MASEYFADEELECRCGCGGTTDNAVLLNGLDKLRRAVGRPLYLSCAYRCPDHNRAVGGEPNSQHIAGTAADVLCPDDMDIREFVWYVNTYSGADGVGVYSDNGFVHIDYRDGGESVGEYRWEG